MWSFKKNIYETRREDSCPDCTPNDVTIGLQTWTACNSVVPTYRDGTTVQTGPHDQSNDYWGPSAGNDQKPYLRDRGNPLQWKEYTYPT